MFVSNSRSLKINHHHFKTLFTNIKEFVNTPLNHPCEVLLNKNVIILNGQSRYYHEDYVTPGSLSGFQHLHDPRHNLGLSFSIKERQGLGIHGLLPPCHRPIEEQVEISLATIFRFTKPIHRHLYMVELMDRCEKLFFKLLSEYPKELMPLVYTPTVGEACLQYGLLFRRPRGLFITRYDKGHIFDVLENWPETHVRVVCITDGERILGLGDLGAHGMPITIGKLALYTALGGIKPHLCLPIVLDVGTNNEKLLNDPVYVGVREKRLPEKEYDEVVDETLNAIVERFGQNTLIQFEDFANHNAFKFLERYRNKFCTFNDDIQGTAGVAVAGLFTSQRITGIHCKDYKILFFGAGEAACGIAELVVYSNINEFGLSEEDAIGKIWMIDVHGLVVKNRLENVEGASKRYVKDFKPMKDLLEIVKELKPNVIIGVSAAGGMFTAEVIREMATINQHPVIFALSNPTHKAECTPLEAYTHSEGRAVYTSGSPFDPVEVNGKTYRPGQGNNAYIFPGIGLGTIASGLHHVTPELFLISARTLAEFVSEEDLTVGCLYPPLNQVKDLSIEMAVKITEYAYSKSLASTYPEPKDKKAFVKSLLYDYGYTSVLPQVYDWPPQKPINKFTHEELLKDLTRQYTNKNQK